jgi:hypothetical protein
VESISANEVDVVLDRLFGVSNGHDAQAQPLDFLFSQYLMLGFVDLILAACETVYLQSALPVQLQ